MAYIENYLFFVFVLANDELFSIKLFKNGEMQENPKKYNGVLMVYVNFCDSDTIRLLEINNMLVECRYRGCCYTFMV